MAQEIESLVERQILGYLKENPKAQDTLCGIVEKWITSQRIMENRITVKAALASLERKGKITSRETADGHVYYHLKRNLEAAHPRGNK